MDACTVVHDHQAHFDNCGEIVAPRTNFFLPCEKGRRERKNSFGSQRLMFDKMRCCLVRRTFFQHTLPLAFSRFQWKDKLLISRLVSVFARLFDLVNRFPIQNKVFKRGQFLLERFHLQNIIQFIMIRIACTVVLCGC